MSFKSGTGMMGSTEPGQKVTKDNANLLPAGSVVKCDEWDGNLIHLHDVLWVYLSDGSWCYDRIENLNRYLPGKLRHIP